MSTRLRIAVAEDEPNMREYLRELLPRLGHEVALAGGGRQLVELCRAAPPDLVITDIRMEEMDGLEAVSAINQERPVPVILLSAHNDAELRQRAAEDYVLAYRVKPVKQADLETAIDLAMCRFRHFQALRQEATDLRQALEDRKVIERAKGVIMRRLRVDEEEGFRPTTATARWWSWPGRCWSPTRCSASWKATAPTRNRTTSSAPSARIPGGPPRGPGRCREPGGTQRRRHAERDAYEPARCHRVVSTNTSAEAVTASDNSSGSRRAVRGVRPRPRAPNSGDHNSAPSDPAAYSSPYAVPGS
jgi:response regulator NasT